MNSVAAHRPRRPRAGLAAAMTAAALVLGWSAYATADCPWIVQPYDQSMPASSEPPTIELAFDELDSGSTVFYGFTATSLDLAFWLARRRGLPKVLSDARPLEPKETPIGSTAYQLSRETIRPHTLYLVAAPDEIAGLEAIEARIEPARPVAVSQLVPKMRGGSPVSGPLPQRSLQGLEISETDVIGQAPAAADTEVQRAEVQICAYQLAMH